MGIEPRTPSSKGPAERFSGEVWIDRIVEAQEGSPLSIGAVHFAPGAHTAWHSHQGGQTLYVTEGYGLVQARGEEAVKIGPGDVYYAPDGQVHWHGAQHNHLMTHLSVTQGTASWGEHVTDEEYSQGARVLM